MTEASVILPEQFEDLLIFEESLRREYIKLKTIRRKYTGQSNTILLIIL